jgi:hypothetical protein
MRSASRTVLGLVLLAVAFVVPGTASAAGDGILVKANGTSYVDITVHQAADIPDGEITFKTKGRYAAFYLLPHFSTHEPVGALWSPRLGAGGSAGRVVPLGAGWEVTPGLYRLYVISEAPTDVFIPLPGGAFRAYRTTHRARASVKQSGFRVDPDDDAAEHRLPATAHSKRSLVTVVSYATSTSLTGVDQNAVCVVPSSMSRKNCGASSIPVLRLPAASARSVDTGLRPAGRYDGVYRLTRTAGVHGDTSVATFLLVLNT